MRGLTPVLKVLLWIKCYQTAFPATEKLNVKGKAINVANFIVGLFLKIIFKLFLKITTATPNFSNHHPAQSAAVYIKARPSTCKDNNQLKTQTMVSIL